ncbi:MAG TPA: substrate-binding domain-containing protein [Burkholderiaceae bacterium]|nr:substrate-binding domain-containing protein [Burkholderiaceae bacterium]
MSSKLNRRNVLKGTLAVAAAPAIITSARAQAKVTWKVQSHWPKASGSFDDSLGVLAKELEQRTDGRFKLELLGAGEIAKGGEIYNVVRRGVVQMGTTSPAYNLAESELLGMYMGIPGTLREPWEMMHLNKNLGLEDAVNEQMRPKGVIYMADKAYPTELVLKKKIEPGADLAGIKVRSAGNLLEYLKAAGFAPQQVAGPEIYQAISTGVVDGAHWGAAIGALSMKFWEVAPVHMKPSLLLAHDVYIINVAAYDKLPEDLRLIFTSLVENRYFQRSVEYQHQEAIALNTGISKMDVKVEHYPDDVLARFAEASKVILAKEMDKGPKAKEMGEKLTSLMKDLGYA